MVVMHLVIPFASAASEVSTHVLRDLALPNLERLLKQLARGPRDDADVYTLSPPHERAIGALQHWQGGDGLLPFGADAAALDGVDVGDAPWATLTPAHWHLGRDHVTLLDPAELQLDESESKAILDSVRELFESEGFRIEWGAAGRWHASHERLEGVATASPDRVIGRNVDLWMRSAGAPADAFMPMLRRLQSECQLLLYANPINEAREARGALSVNSFWLSGCGRAQPVGGAVFEVDHSLRTPLLAADWAAWGEAWRALDTGPIVGLLAAQSRREAVQLTLCGERAWQRFQSEGATWLGRLSQRFQAPGAVSILEAL